MTRKLWTVVPKRLGVGGEGGSSGKALFGSGYKDTGFIGIH